MICGTLTGAISDCPTKRSAGPDPTYGTILDQQPATGGGAPEVQASVTWQTVTGAFRDGTPYSLRKPVLNMSGLRDGAPDQHRTAH